VARTKIGVGLRFKQEPALGGVNVMGVDLSLRSTGVIILSGDGGVVFRGSNGYDLKKTATPIEKTERLIDVADWVSDVYSKFDVTHVAVEEKVVSTKRPGAHLDLAELHGVIRVNMWEIHHVGMFRYGVSALRKSVLGKGYKTKKETHKVLISRMFEDGVCCSGWTKDEIDAYLVARYQLYIVACGEKK